MLRNLLYLDCDLTTLALDLMRLLKISVSISTFIIVIVITYIVLHPSDTLNPSWRPPHSTHPPLLEEGKLSQVDHLRVLVLRDVCLMEAAAEASQSPTSSSAWAGTQPPSENSMLEFVSFDPRYVPALRGKAEGKGNNEREGGGEEEQAERRRGSRDGESSLAHDGDLPIFDVNGVEEWRRFQSEPLPINLSEVGVGVAESFHIHFALIHSPMLMVINCGQQASTDCRHKSFSIRQPTAQELSAVHRGGLRGGGSKDGNGAAQDTMFSDSTLPIIIYSPWMDNFAGVNYHLDRIAVIVHESSRVWPDRVLLQGSMARAPAERESCWEKCPTCMGNL